MFSQRFEALQSAEGFAPAPRLQHRVPAGLGTRVLAESFFPASLLAPEVKDLVDVSGRLFWIVFLIFLIFLCHLRKNLSKTANSIPPINRHPPPQYLYAEANNALLRAQNTSVEAGRLAVPAAKLTLGELEKGESLLQQIFDMLRDPKASKQHLKQLSDDFYATVPMADAAPLTTLAAVAKRQEDVQLFRDLLSVNEVIGAAERADDRCVVGFDCGVVGFLFPLFSKLLRSHYCCYYYYYYFILLFDYEVLLYDN